MGAEITYHYLCYLLFCPLINYESLHNIKSTISIAFANHWSIIQKPLLLQGSLVSWNIWHKADSVHETIPLSQKGARENKLFKVLSFFFFFSKGLTLYYFYCYFLSLLQLMTAQALVRSSFQDYFQLHTLRRHVTYQPIWVVPFYNDNDCSAHFYWGWTIFPFSTSLTFHIYVMLFILYKRTWKWDKKIIFIMCSCKYINMNTMSNRVFLKWIWSP